MDIPTITAVFSLLFATITYWFDYYNKEKVKKETKKNLELEIGLLYRTVLINILRYKEVKESNYQKGLILPVYNYPILKYIVTNNKINDYFNNGEEYLVGLNIYQILTQLDNPQKGGFTSPIIPNDIDWFFKNRLLNLREEILNLVKYGNVTSNLIIREDMKEMHSKVLEFITIKPEK